MHSCCARARRSGIVLAIAVPSTCAHDNGVSCECIARIADGPILRWAARRNHIFWIFDCAPFATTGPGRRRDFIPFGVGGNGHWCYVRLLVELGRLFGAIGLDRRAVDSIAAAIRCSDRSCGWLAGHHVRTPGIRISVPPPKAKGHGHTGCTRDGASCVVKQRVGRDITIGHVHRVLVHRDLWRGGAGQGFGFAWGALCGSVSVEPCYRQYEKDCEHSSDDCDQRVPTAAAAATTRPLRRRRSTTTRRWYGCWGGDGSTRRAGCWRSCWGYSGGHCGRCCGRMSRWCECRRGAGDTRREQGRGGKSRARRCWRLGWAG
eukprot:m.320951 g.320951  ORF g.320951 m.320951 type:complete len:318 (-) comp27590_c0_seq5:1228-2181(-)